MSAKFKYFLFIALSSYLFSSCIEQAVKYNNEPENETVFVASTDKNVYALDAHTGAKKWTVDVGSEIIQGTLLSDSLLYVVCADQKVYAVNYLNQKKRWNTLVGNVVNMTLSNGLIYFRNSNRILQVLDAQTGIKRWSAEIYNGADSIPTFGTDVVLIRTHKDTLKAFEPQTGGVRWKKVLRADFKANPTTSAGTTYYTSDSLYAVDNSDGRKKWGYFVGIIIIGQGTRTVFISQTNAIHLINGLVYFADETTKNLTSIRADSAIFRRTFNPINGITKLGAINSVIYAYTKGGGLTAVDTSLRNQVWKLGIDVNLQNDPTIVSGIIFAGSSGKAFYALDGRTGTKKWTLTTADNSPARSTFSNDIVFVNSPEGNIFALDAETGVQRWTFKTNGKLYGKPAITTTDRKIYQ
jgi:eukaryotic-like serine/threonine-protein kinase